MNPPGSFPYSPCSDRPRAGGDEPWMVTPIPDARTPDPAGAGKNRPQLVREYVRVRRPRRGGDQPMLMIVQGLLGMKTPPGRGWTILINHTLQDMTSDPAGVGMNLFPASLWAENPRSLGDEPSEFANS